ncbi:hypothetical protein G7009_06865 [Pseudomonas capeferrum]|uniref:hypothetical protein n=1 Tax=Pseudomonas capeferrum TaxID=1495066 RepID=UPI0015E2ECC0|nr:hypothetical protein [Pseudomonas capeferrum]MBA1201481.1 hypothetical protein [Pseudomonas capeferrum]
MIAHPFDTHPLTALRLQHLGVTLDERLLAQATRAPTDADRLDSLCAGDINAFRGSQ